MKKRIVINIGTQNLEEIEVMAEWFSYGWCAYAGRGSYGWTVARLPGGPGCAVQYITGIDREVAFLICAEMSKLEQKTAPASPRLDDLKEVARRYLGSWVI